MDKLYLFCCDVNYIIFVVFIYLEFENVLFFKLGDEVEYWDSFTVISLRYLILCIYIII